MKLEHFFLCGIACLVVAGGRLLAADNNPTNSLTTTPPVYVPDMSHQNSPMPEGVLAWDSVQKQTSVAADATTAHFTFSFTNISGSGLAVVDVHPSCGCTTAQVPPLPWIIPDGTNASFGLTVNVAGKTGTLFKTVNFKTDKGFKQLVIQITMLPPVIPTQSEADRARALEMAKADRQTIFRGDCMTCHVKPGEGRYGKTLYDAVCAICHEGEHRASLVPDLHQIKSATNADFWQTWIAHGKAGSVMPAFSTTDGGPLSDMQITSLVQYLASVFPSQATGNK